jgi:hypothetical protein
MMSLNPLRKRIIAGLQRHKNLVTFIGASIAFGTFVARDVLKENAKDLADATERARSNYSIRTLDIYLSTKRRKRPPA